jgi:polyhydroxybutyrate depolymerase
VAPTEQGAFDPEPFGGDRPVSLYVPRGYVAGEPLPLVVLLHGYGAAGKVQEYLFGLKKVADERRFLYLHPDGTFDATGKRHWNATNACCGFGVSTADDVGYLTGLLDEVEARYAVDKKRVYFLGHSNGGFMSYRMACELGGRVAGVASLAGATFASADDCKPAAPVSALQIHGTADDLVLYDGGLFYGQPYPSAKKTVELWAGYDGCSGEPEAGDPVDVEPNIAGAESTVLTYKSCKEGSAVSLWSIQGGAHIPALGDGFRFGVMDFLLAHPRPLPAW